MGKIINNGYLPSDTINKLLYKLLYNYHVFFQRKTASRIVARGRSTNTVFASSFISLGFSLVHVLSSAMCPAGCSPSLVRTTPSKCPEDTMCWP